MQKKLLICINLHFDAIIVEVGMNQSKVISKHTFIAIYVTVCLSIFYIIGIITSGNGFNIQFVSFIGFCLLLYIFISWKKVYYRILSPYIIIISTLFLTLCGQALVWTFGMTAGYRDLRYAAYKTVRFNTSSLCLGLLFSYLCISAMHMVVINSVNSKTHKTKTKNKTLMSPCNQLRVNVPLNVTDKNLYKVLVGFALVLMSITIIPYITTNVKTYEQMILEGYGIQYTNVTYGIASIISKISEFFPIGVVTLLYAWGKKNSFNGKYYLLKAIFSYLIVTIYLFFQLRLSQRTGILLFAIALLFIFYADKKIPTKLISLGIFIGIILMAVMRMIDLLRSGEIIGLQGFIIYAMDEKNNPILDFLGDIGWNLMTTVKFQEVIPHARNFGFGSSYFISLTSIIPNLNFWTVHPAYAYGNISSWLQEYLGFSFGIGCTPVAEAYYNFGPFGFLIFIFWGKVAVYLNRKFDQRKSILDNYQVVLFMGILLKAFVRSSFFAVFRPFVLYVCFPAIMIQMIYKVLSAR